ncbi:MAG: hypothetical protein ABSE40_24450, partial [Candidatus Sulfotelmatobacter sp.]
MMRIVHGSQAYAVWEAVYRYTHSVLSVVAVAIVFPALARASRSDRSRNRVLGCQMKRRNRAVQMTEKTPDTTSVMRWKACVEDVNHCMTAKERPAHSVPGHTSQASFQVPPSILTNAATSQKGTRTETKGSWCPAMADSFSSGRPLTAARVTMGVPMAPQATGAVLARRLRTADSKGANPRPTMTAPAMATGVP